MNDADPQSRGLFLTFEGGEGAGKSTQIQRLAEALRLAGRDVLVTREPGGTAVGEALRHLLKHDPAGESLVPEAEFLLFAASRAQLVREVIQPALERGGIVISDRFHDSSIVYQGIARGLGVDAVNGINRFAIGETEPDTTFFLNLAPETGLERVHARTNPDDARDRLDRETLAFHQKVRDGYLTLAKLHSSRIVNINAAADPDEVARQIRNFLFDRHGLSLGNSL